MKKSHKIRKPSKNTQHTHYCTRNNMRETRRKKNTKNKECGTWRER